MWGQGLPRGLHKVRDVGTRTTQGSTQGEICVGEDNLPEVKVHPYPNSVSFHLQKHIALSPPSYLDVVLHLISRLCPPLPLKMSKHCPPLHLFRDPLFHINVRPCPHPIPTLFFSSSLGLVFHLILSLI